MTTLKLQFTQASVKAFLLKRAQQALMNQNVHPKKLGAHFHEYMKLEQLTQPGPEKAWADAILLERDDVQARKAILALTV